LDCGGFELEELTAVARRKQEALVRECVAGGLFGL
jgi:hypothetical protein